MILNLRKIIFLPKFQDFLKQEKCVTKFGGQPIGLNQNDWPKSKETGNLMQFIGQIVFDKKLFPEAKGKEEFVDDTWDPEGGENAVIIGVYWKNTQKW